MARIMLVGRIGSGKTTLIQRLCEKDIRYDKTQMIEFGNNVIDTPGEFLESRGYYSALIVTSMESDMVGLVIDCSNDNNSFPPGFARMFSKPTIGIITKTDLLNENQDCEYAENMLKLAGAEKIFKVSSINNENMEELKKYLNM